MVNPPVRFRDRKAQTHGGDSLWISLPVEWTRARNLKRGDLLSIVLAPNGDLIIGRGGAS